MLWGYPHPCCWDENSEKQSRVIVVSSLFIIRSTHQGKIQLEPPNRDEAQIFFNQTYLLHDICCRPTALCSILLAKSLMPLILIRTEQNRFRLPIKNGESYYQALTYTLP